jgi:F420-non-reducing hydrogenase small subunit
LCYGPDWKYSDIEKVKDVSVDVTFYNGGVRNTENEHIAKLLRQKSKLVVAYGACACFGGIPGLANISDRQGIFDKVYKDTISTNNPEGIFPQPEYRVPEGTLTLPILFDSVKPLNDIIDVDYYLPGCPPTTERILDLITAIKAYALESKPLPPKGTIFAQDKSLCEECPRVRKEKKISRIVRIHELTDDYKSCLLEQGVVCLGISTRAGCNARCIKVNMPCRGCFGPTSTVIDQGGSMLSAITSNLAIGENELDLTDKDIERIVAQVKDPLGTFYRYTLACSLLKHVYRELGGSSK